MVKRLALLCIGAICSFSVFASSGWTGSYNVGGFVASTPEAACEAAKRYSFLTYELDIISTNPFSAKCNYYNNGASYLVLNVIVMEAIPPAPKCPASGPAGSFTFQGSAPSSFCDGSCILSKSGISVGTTDNSGVTSWLAGYSHTGESCDMTGDPISPTFPPTDSGNDLPDPTAPCYTDTSTPETTDCTLVSDKGDEVPPGEHSPDDVCDEVNGAFGCTNPKVEGCDYRNGQYVCYAPDGSYVPNDSPDHPDNGGNLDGNDSNDPNDPRPVTEGGDPNNQVDDTTGQGANATEGTAQEQLEQLGQLNKNAREQNKNLEEIGSGLNSLGTGIGTLNQTTSKIEEQVSAAVDATRGDPSALKQGIRDAIGESGDQAITEYDDHITGIGEPGPMDSSDLSGVKNPVSNLFEGSGCSDLSFGHAGLAFDITCADMQPIRDALGWVLYAFTVIRLFHIVRRPVPSGA